MWKKRLAASVVAALVSVVVVAPESAASQAQASIRAQVAKPAKDCDNAHRQFFATKPAKDGGWVPVVLVHGITSSADAWLQSPIGGGASFAQSLAKLPGIAVYTFDYRTHSLEWVTSDAIAGELARAISCLTRISQHRVIAIGHSMGGLAIQQGQSYLPTKALAAAVTIGSPIQGSQFLEAGEGVLAGLVRAEPRLGVVANAVLKWCGFDGGNRSNDATCGLLAARDTLAGRAMMPGSLELAALPQWKAGIPVTRIAADMQVSVNVGPAQKQFRIGDIAVSRASATFGGTEAPFVDTCNQVPVTQVASNPCAHGKELQNPAIIAQVMNRVRKLGVGGLAYVPDVHDVDFSAVTLPAEACDNGSPPLQLTNYQGDNGLPFTDTDRWEGGITGDVVFADVNSDGRDEAVVHVYCIPRGGNYTVHSLWTYRLSLDGALEPLGGRISGISQSNYSPNLRFVMDGRDIVVTEIAWHDLDIHCCPTQKAETRWRFDGKQWVSSVVEPRHPATLDPDGLSTDGVQPLKFGDSVQRAEEVTGLKAKSGGCGDNVSFIENALFGLTLNFSNGVFVSYRESSIRDRTLSGARVGMSVADLQKLVPYAVPELRFETTTLYVVRSGGNTLAFIIKKSAPVVEQITATVGNDALVGC